MLPRKFDDAVAGLLAVSTVAAVSFAALVLDNKDALSALTLGLGLVFGWYFRGKVQTPS